MESCSQGGAPLMAQTLGTSINVDNQESNESINESTLYRLLAKKDSIIEKLQIKIVTLEEEIRKLKKQHNTIVPDQPSEFNRKKIIALISCSNADKCADILIEETSKYKDKNKPKKGLMPLFCAIKNGWLERPSYKDFNEAFPGVCENDASYSKYIPDGKDSEYETKPKKSFNIEAHCENMQEKLSASLK